MSGICSYVKADLSMLPVASQERVIRKYLSIELIPSGWSCKERSFIENIRSLYKPSNVRIQIHGSPERLEKKLELFMSFPGSQEFFQFDDSTFYRPLLPFYQSLGGKTYIYKKDIYELLFDSVPIINASPPLQKLAHTLIMYYLRTLEKRLATSHEMICCDDEFRERFSDNKQLLNNIMTSEDWKRHKASFPAPKTCDELLSSINSILMKFKIGDGMGEEMREVVTMITKDAPVHKNGSQYKNILTLFYLTILVFEDFISENEIKMLSRSETVHSFPTTKIPVRLFESDQQKVVMSHELLHAIKLENIDVSGFEDKILTMPKLSAMSFREVFQIVPGNIVKMLEFIRIPLKSASTELYIIPTIDGSYCISAYQVLVVILNDAVIVKKIFQGMTKDQYKHIMEEFYALLVDTLCHGDYFVSYDKYEETKSFLGTWFKENFPSPNQKEILKVHKKGFNCDDLKQQLERLELSEIFPKIEEYAYIIPENRQNFGCVYKATNQMLQHIQDAQFSYISSLLPTQLNNMLHERTLNHPTVKAADDSNVSVENKTKKEEEILNETVVTSSDTASLVETLETSSTEKPDDSKSECLSPSATVETVVLEKQEPVQKPKKPKKKNEKSVEKPEVKESQACPKCIRASEYTKTTNEKLRLSKIEVKHLKKELSVVELALEEKNERIRVLEEKLREKENQLNLKSSEVDTLNTKKQELERENKRNERLIATFPEVISKKDLAIKSLQSQSNEKDKLIKELKSEKSKAIPSRSKEESEKIETLLSKILETKTILSKDKPVEKSNEICDAMIAKTNSKVTEQLVKYETKVFQLQVSSYIRIVENNIKIIEGNLNIKMNQIPEIPDFPEFSEEFKSVHKSIMKKEAPLLCRQLLNLTDEIADMECVICLDEMESHDGTTKCAECKRRYHNHCIRPWLKKKNICPACKKGMVDEQEFPAL